MPVLRRSCISEGRHGQDAIADLGAHSLGTRLRLFGGVVTAWAFSDPILDTILENAENDPLVGARDVSTCAPFVLAARRFVGQTSNPQDCAVMRCWSGRGSRDPYFSATLEDALLEQAQIPQSCNLHGAPAKRAGAHACSPWGPHGRGSACARDGPPTLGSATPSFKIVSLVAR